ncbi:beta-1,3-galactosyl-O-glycosyl-glycoprotein beta-1,6-N-acetylglucosaminyltransferase [Larimichthys crocea]|uniref:beta-1,3-galactosyl-O-glycosyl-glycoprotein beta-1,6-N-acetylglucosaminyltransferase n=1 Tax=Larimichthys crocea TaxID=215358 RepID=UPI000F5D9724|nr:beta-1,3-galactosyl-O-glycosyl-glycoprotein beta-1,6-N-acetylglucosaminyltransferase [Larimichthys crocea]
MQIISFISFHKQKGNYENNIKDRFSWTPYRTHTVKTSWLRSCCQVMRLLRRRRLKLLLKLTVVLGSLWMLYLLGWPRTGWRLEATYSLRHSWLEYTDDDGGPEKVCNCSAILQGEREALDQAKLLSITKDFQKNVRIPDEYYINATQDCSEFRLSRKYLMSPLSQEEEDFPLAYSLVVHHKVQNFERLLRAIYAPQNIYCVHVDRKSEVSVFAAIQAITSCFPNVFMVSKAVNVVYGHWSRIQADLNCMADLYNISTEWKYLINLCGQDFPLKTNLEIVRMLRSLRGGNSMESEEMPEHKKQRVTDVYQIVDGEIQRTSKKKGPLPFNLPILSGNAYIVVSRGYIRSVLEDNRIQTLIEWSKDTYSPDEFFWATIQRIPGVPGSTRPHRKYDMTDINAIARLVKWQGHEGPQDSLQSVYTECHGHHVRGICVYGAGDLQWMVEQHHLFANKFDTDKDPIAVYCLEKYLRHKALADVDWML